MLENIMIVNRAGSGCDYHRIGLPFSFMPDVQLVHTYSKANLLVFNRLPIEPVELFLSQKKRFGFKYIVDLDDYWYLYKHHHLAAAWERGEVSKKIETIINNADAITVTNKNLADKVRDFNPRKKIFIVPNALPFDEPGTQFKDNINTPERPTFIFAGGKSHYYDLLLFKNAIEPLIKSNEWKFILAGIDGKCPIWQRTARLFSGIPHYEQRQAAPISNYMQLYNFSSVSIAPLEYNDFNSCKSNLKVLEAGCKNLMCITSDMPPYRNDLDKGYITRCCSPVQWYNAIKYAINNPGYIKENGLRLGEHVRNNYQLKKANDLRIQIYASLLQ